MEILRAGGLVAFPTETVYGLGADAANPEAVGRVFAAKGRPPSHPLIVHLASAAGLAAVVRDIPPPADRLAKAFWPGPLTMVLPKSAAVLAQVTGGLDTVAVRVPAHPLALSLLLAFGDPLVAPSANRFGRVSSTSAGDVRADLGDRVDLVIDGGRCPVGVESTIVDLSGDPPSLLRPGGVTREQLEDALGRRLTDRPRPGMRAPGMLPSHYAPEARVVVVSAAEVAEAVAGQLERGARVGVLCAEAPPGLPSTAVVLSAGNPSLEAYARGLYRLLREADRQGCDVVVAVVPEEQGMGAAVADRLRRAAGPRLG